MRDKQQVGHVHAGHQEDEAHGAEQHEQGRPRAAHQRLLQGQERAPDALVRIRVLPGQALRDRRDLVLRPLDRDSRLEPRDHGEVPGPAALGAEALVVLERRPKLRPLRVGEAGGRNPHDLVGLAVQLQALTDDAGSPPKRCRQRVSDRTATFDLAGLVLVTAKGPSLGRPNAEHVEEARAHPGGFDPDGRAPAGEGRSAAVDRGHGLEALRLRLEVEEVLGRVDLGESAFPGLGDLDQALGLRVGQRPEQDRAHHAVDGAVGADAQGEGGNRHQREPGGLPKPLQGVDEVLAQDVHDRSP